MRATSKRRHISAIDPASSRQDGRGSNHSRMGSIISHIKSSLTNLLNRNRSISAAPTSLVPTTPSAMLPLAPMTTRKGRAATVMIRPQSTTILLCSAPRLATSPASASTSRISIKKTGFLSLPLEIRDMIYNYLDPSSYDSKTLSRAFCTWAEPTPALFYANRQIFLELTRWYERNVRFAYLIGVDLPDLQDPRTHMRRHTFGPITPAGSLALATAAFFIRAKRAHRFWLEVASGHAFAISPMGNRPVEMRMLRLIQGLGPDKQHHYALYCEHVFDLDVSFDGTAVTATLLKTVGEPFATHDAQIHRIRESIGRVMLNAIQRRKGRGVSLMEIDGVVADISKAYRLVWGRGGTPCDCGEHV